ncbi:unnamed protein product [Moneuplotes crassus]|uniref:Uncharacterized protein n=2 Tax=Euplotes crassus TaxID=5936 RepID=A0AAD1U1J3_EUPCR|nr:unnamed protein product [Moneuplotes crassus]
MLTQKLGSSCESTLLSSQLKFQRNFSHRDNFHHGLMHDAGISGVDSCDLLNDSDYKNPFDSCASHIDKNDRAERLTTDSFFHDREPITGRHFDMRASFQGELERLGFDRKEINLSQDSDQYHSQEGYHSEADSNLMKDVEQRFAEIIQEKNAALDNSQTLMEDLRDANYSCDSKQNYEYFDLSEFSHCEAEEDIEEQNQSTVHHKFTKVTPSEDKPKEDQDEEEESHLGFTLALPTSNNIGDVFCKHRRSVPCLAFPMHR